MFFDLRPDVVVNTTIAEMERSDRGGLYRGWAAAVQPGIAFISF